MVFKILASFHTSRLASSKSNDVACLLWLYNASKNLASVMYVSCLVDDSVV